jgi:hypothetical protein
MTDVQCYVCGKTGLSVVEDGGPECEIGDGQWVCSRECYDRAVGEGDAPERVDRIARAICAEQCAEYGEPPCHKTGPWPNEGCDEPGCIALATATLTAQAAEIAELTDRAEKAEADAVRIQCSLDNVSLNSQSNIAYWKEQCERNERKVAETQRDAALARGAVLEFSAVAFPDHLKVGSPLFVAKPRHDRQRACTMTDAPERIYIDGGPRGRWMHRHERMPDTQHEYIRADLIPAMLAEAEQRGREAEREAIATALVSAYTASGQEEGGE